MLQLPVAIGGTGGGRIDIGKGWGSGVEHRRSKQPGSHHAAGGADRDRDRKSAPLLTLHCLLVLDGLHAELLADEAVHELLTTLLSAARVRTLLTAREPVGQLLQGGAEKVITLPAQSAINSPLVGY